MEDFNKRLTHPAWVQPERRPHFPSLICSSCTSGLLLIVTGGVLVTLFRSGPSTNNFSLGGIAILALGMTFFGVGAAISIFAIITRQRLPKTSSAANAHVPVDPYCLAPMYPSTVDLHGMKNSNINDRQIFILPGGLEPLNAYYHPT
ncbi:hypothetical protein JTE90_012321 [Oedothorax gibbosus]|uniref:Transmembrane protein 230 n=1 Tax=Oedothorax gibbosus TaxID=931172 RepID=A0AAV6VKD8_9ARAC|nr:hypothetical protein JTE90_012321 [Oedothorax gibbosus]